MDDVTYWDLVDKAKQGLLQPDEYAALEEEARARSDAAIAETVSEE